MSTSQTTTGLSRPTGDDKISLGTLGYINARNRQRAYDIVIKEFNASGITQATLASRLGKMPDVVCRLLSRPQNWESDTFSSLIFAISGGVPKYDVAYPLGKSGATEAPTRMVAARSTQSGQVINLMEFLGGRIVPQKSTEAESKAESINVQVQWATGWLMPGPGEFLNVVLCEDIRDETGNKKSLMGVLAGDILVPSFPGTLKIAVYMNYIQATEDGENLSIAIRILQDDMEIAKATMGG